jgi:hypothetical protein
MESARENEQVVTVQFVQTRGKLAIIDQTTGLVDDQEREDDPDGVLAVEDQGCGRVSSGHGGGAPGVEYSVTGS